MLGDTGNKLLKVDQIDIIQNSTVDIAILALLYTLKPEGYKRYNRSYRPFQVDGKPLDKEAYTAIDQIFVYDYYKDLLVGIDNSIYIIITKIILMLAFFLHF